jgi:hypothetical protein
MRALIGLYFSLVMPFEAPPGHADARTYHPQQNPLLAALPSAERERLYPHLELIAMPLGRVLYESGDTLLHVYFPLDSVVSLLYVMEDGASEPI